MSVGERGKRGGGREPVPSAAITKGVKEINFSLSLQ